MGPRASALEFGGLTEILQASRLCPCQCVHVPVADAAACTDAGVAVAAPPTGAVIFGVAAVAAAAGFGPPEGGRWCRGIALISALLEGVEGAGGLPSATGPAPTLASAAGALRVASRTGPTPVMSRSDSLSNVEVGLAAQVCYSVGALHVEGRTGPTPVMSRSDSLSKYVTLLPS